MGLHDKLREAAAKQPKADPMKICLGLVRRNVLTERELAEALAELFRHEQRLLALAHEREIFGSFMGARKSTVPIVVPAEMSKGYADLFGEASFRIGNGGDPIEWRYATVEQHEQRIAMLEAMRAGLDRTIAQHRYWVDRIREAGVACLADLDKVSA